MGARYGGQCYTSAVEAGRDACSVVFPKVLEGGDVLACLSASAGADVQSALLALSRYPAAGGPAVQADQPLSFVACDPLEPYTDASVLWAAGLAAIVLVWCMKTFVLKLVVNQ